MGMYRRKNIFAEAYQFTGSDSVEGLLEWFNNVVDEDVAKIHCSSDYGKIVITTSKNNIIEIFEGQYVVIEDGDNFSWALPEYFENEFSELQQSEFEGFSFGDAIDMLKEGLSVCREGWNGKGLWLELQLPDENSKMTLPYIYMCYPSDAVNTPGARVPWLASQTDMLAEDWFIFQPSTQK